MMVNVHGKSCFFGQSSKTLKMGEKALQMMESHMLWSSQLEKNVCLCG